MLRRFELGGQPDPALKAKLEDQFAQGEELAATIRQKLAGVLADG
jgi:hypothetical protein